MSSETGSFMSWELGLGLGVNTYTIKAKRFKKEINDEGFINC